MPPLMTQAAQPQRIMSTGMGVHCLKLEWPGVPWGALPHSNSTVQLQNQTVPPTLTPTHRLHGSPALQQRYGQQENDNDYHQSQHDLRALAPSAGNLRSEERRVG